jgi:hypothetical protein
MASKPHWLAPSGKTKTPNVIVTFDTETSEVDAGDHTVQHLRCWDALVRVRRPTSTRQRRATLHSGESSPALADVIESAFELDDEVWVIAHNVGFDLSVTSLPFILAERDWQLDSLHLGDESCWWIMKRAKHKVIITDSWSWLRCPLEAAAKDIGRRKVALPTADDDLATWHRRSRHDVEILDEIMVTVLDWWDKHQLGVFGITGAACGWRTLRNQIEPKRILVGPDGARTAFERRAVFSGKKEVYGVGEFHESWIADFDFVAAYPTTVAAHPLPSMPAKKWTTTDKMLDAPPPPQRDYIAEVEITTRRPCAPCRVNGEVWWPVGTFRTVLAGPEVRYCLEVAESVTVIEWASYKTGFALADWAAWCIGVQTDTTGEVPEVVKRVAKGWGRSVVGRFAARTSRVVDTRPSTHLGWHLETGHDLDTGAALEWLSMGGIEQTIAKDVDGPDVFPAVLAFVEAHTRVALGRMVASRPPENVLQCNTDGWWEMRSIRRSDYVPDGVPWPFRVVRKALERSLLVRGPNHVMTPHERRYAGIPRAATTNDDRTMHWHDWPGLRWQLEHGVTGQYHRPEREAVLSDHYVRRWVLDTGETIPVTSEVDSEGNTALVAWSRSWGRRDDDHLADYQVPTLAKLLEGDVDPPMRVNVPLPPQPGRGFQYTPKPLRWQPRHQRRVIVPASDVAPEPLLHLDQN